MNAISSLNRNAAYYAQPVLSFLRASLGQGVLPVWNVVSSVLQLAEARFPMQMLADDMDDNNGSDFFLTADNHKQVAERIVAKRVTVRNGSDAEKASVREHMQVAYIVLLKQEQDTVTRLSRKMGLSKVHLCVSLPEDWKKIVSEYACCHDRFSQDGPVIQYYPLMTWVTQGPHKTQLQLQQGNCDFSDPVLGNKKKEFVYAHELTHASRYHIIQMTALNSLAAIVNTSMWAYSITTGGLNVETFISAFPQIVLVHVTFTAALLGLSRLHEMQADKGAMDILESNEGAIAFFAGQQHNPVDISHPSMNTRLAYARHWQKKSR